MATIHEQTPESVLAIYAHPDDADVACAGTLSRWVKEGSRVHLLILADGGKGTIDATTDTHALSSLRAEEVEAACAITGVSWENLGRSDGEIENDALLREFLVTKIRALRPEVVLSHDPTAVFFGEHYFNHHDHRALGWAVLDAVSPMATLPHYFPSAGAPHGVAEVLLSGTLEPNCFVDVSSQIDVKVAAVACHRSQFDDDGGQIGDVLRLRAEDDGRRVGLSAAEGFRRLRPNG
ncbi:MAG: PIG-L deacetylase family protein [Actinomycetota bacterium]